MKNNTSLEELKIIQDRILNNGQKSKISPLSSPEMNKNVQESIITLKGGRRKPKHLESQLQQNCLKWFKIQYGSYCYTYYDEKNKPHTYCALIKNCNEGSKSDVKRMIEYNEGLTAGVADLSLKLPSFFGCYHGLEIELKSKTGKQTLAQKAYQEFVEKHGYKYILINSFDDFKKEIDSYMKG